MRKYRETSVDIGEGGALPQKADVQIDQGGAFRKQGDLKLRHGGHPVRVGRGDWIFLLSYQNPSPT